MSSSTIAILIVLLGSFVCPGYQEDISPRIIGGTDALIEDYPYMVSVQNWFSHICGGTILNEYFILTAAHCVEGALIDSLTVLYATKSLLESGHRSEVAWYRIYDSYSSNKIGSLPPTDDIAIIKLTYPINATKTGKYVGPVALSTSNEIIPEDTRATVVGWGKQFEGGSYAEILQHVEVNTVENSMCDVMNKIPTNPNKICAGVLGGRKGMCFGDSGGPLLIDDVQVGIASWSKSCALDSLPAVYTNVASYVDWIDEILGDEYIIDYSTE